MKLSKIALSSMAALALALAVSSAPQEKAAMTENTDATEITDVIESPINDNIAITPRINWTDSAALTKNVWGNVIGSNNIFRDTPTITNWAGNPGEAVFRIVDGSENIIAESDYVKPGKSTKLGSIPAFSGTYTLQAMVEKTGNYTIEID